MEPSIPPITLTLIGATSLNLPVYLDAEVQSYLRERASSKGIELNQLVNELLRRDIEMVESVR